MEKMTIRKLCVECGRPAMRMQGEPLCVKHGKERLKYVGSVKDEATLDIAEAIVEDCVYRIGVLKIDIKHVNDLM